MAPAPAQETTTEENQQLTALVQDFYCKSAQDHLIAPHTQSNMILFVPTSDYQPNFALTLTDASTNTPLTLSVSTQ